MQTLRIATRKSPLALWQARTVMERIQAIHPDLQVSLVEISTKGDRMLETSLARIGGKGLFIKELEHAMLEGAADIAVHSIKDMPAELPKGFALGPILARENPLDAFVSNEFNSLAALPNGARVGTCSLRRGAQLLAHNPTLKILDLRGNVNTRLQKLDSGNYDAIILAVAGLLRLEMNDRIKQEIPVHLSLPAVGQGAVAIEIREGDERIATLLAPLDDPDTRTRVTAERAMNRTLDGGCQAPVAGYATLDEDQLSMTGRVLSIDGTTVLESTQSVPREQADSLGVSIAETLLSEGADKILAAIKQAEKPN